MHDLAGIAANFDLRADFIHGHPYGSGHINDTYCIWCDQAGQRIRYILQRINHKVFKNPVALSENVARVTDHALQRLLDEGNPEARRRTLTTIPAHDGKPYSVDAAGNTWRIYPFIERARGYDEIVDDRQAEEAAKAFGNFQKLAADLGGQRLHETIPDFHHTRKRFEAMVAAAEADTEGRAAEVAGELDFVAAREADCSLVLDMIAGGEIPERVTHNDTKLNNVLLDDVTSEGVCVIDLDTTMPGSVLYDFGDMVRTAATTTREDDPDLSKVDVRIGRFEALVRGYLDSAGSFLNPAELDHLAFAGKLLTFECGIRFLTDYLQGDVYFKIGHPTHNLDRARNQFALVGMIEKRLAGMQDIVARHSAG